MRRAEAVNDPGQLGLRQRLRFLARDSLLYGGAAAFNKAFGLITFPLLARHFSVAEYGLIDFFAVLAGLMGTFFIFGQDSAVARFFYEYKDEGSRRQLISQSLLLQMVSVLALMPVLWTASGRLGPALSEASDSAVLLKLILLQVPFLVLINFSQNLLKWTFSRSRFLFISLGSVVLNVVLLLIAVLVLDIGVSGVFKVALSVQIGFGLLGLYFVRHWLTIPENLRFLKEIVPYAVPYGLICCLGAFVPSMERTLVNSLLGPEELGLYAAGAKVAMLVSLLSQAFQTAWGPFSLAIHKEADAATTYNDVLKVFAIAVCVAVLLLSAGGGWIIRLVASARYAAADVVVFPLAMGLAIQATSWITEIGISLSKRSYLSLYGYSALVLTTGGAVFVLGTIFGIVGIAIGVMLGQVARATISSLVAQWVYPMPWGFKGTVIVLLATLTVGSLGSWSIAHGNSTSGYLVMSAGVPLLLFCGWYLAFSKVERLRIMTLFGRRAAGPQGVKPCAG